jgi:hypothetical protein
LHQCDTAGQTNPVVQDCVTAAHCNAAGGNCYLCDVGQYRCSGTILQQCAANRLGFEDGPDCLDMAKCDDQNGQCLP